MKMQKLFAVGFTLFLLMFSHQQCHAATTDPQKDSLNARDSMCDTSFVCHAEHFDCAQHELRRGDKQIVATPNETFRKKKLITSILAFPIPFGFIGLHRIYLGTAPWVPIAYLCTGGGGLGLLPIIDFIFIVTANEEEFKKYENNQSFFMFVE